LAYHPQRHSGHLQRVSAIARNAVRDQPGTGVHDQWNAQGMYVASYIGMNLEMGEEVEYSPLVGDGDRILGGLFVVAGFHFYLALDPTGPPADWSNIESLGSTWRAAALRWRFREFRANIAYRPSHVIQFNW